MDGLRRSWSRWRKAFGIIKPADRCLTVFMAVLLLQSAYSLFSGAASAGDGGHVDVIVRTASAAVFGYFLSAKEEGTAEERQAAHCLRAAAAAGMGLFCLATLLALRNLSLWEAAAAGGESATATVAQFRDFVSGCVGFLIGAPASRSADPTT